MTKKKVENILQIYIMSGFYFMSGNGARKQRIYYWCEELNTSFTVTVKVPDEEYFEEHNTVFIRDALRHFFES